MISSGRRRLLTTRLKPIVDGILDKARRRAEDNYQDQFDRDWYGSGQWQRSRPHSYELEIVESTTGNPLGVLGRAIDGVHCGELTSIALVAIGRDGVIHTAWSDGDYALMGRAAEFLGDDLGKVGS